jgi:hypothetical protein
LQVTLLLGGDLGPERLKDEISRVAEKAHPR